MYIYIEIWDTIYIYHVYIYYTINLAYSPKLLLIFTSRMIYVDQFNWAVRLGTHCIWDQLFVLGTLQRERGRETEVEVGFLKNRMWSICPVLGRQWITQEDLRIWPHGGCDFGGKQSFRIVGWWVVWSFGLKLNWHNRPFRQLPSYATVHACEIIHEFQ